MSMKRQLSSEEGEKTVTIFDVFQKRQKCGYLAIIHSSELKIGEIYKLEEFRHIKVQNIPKIVCTIMDSFSYFLPNRFNEYVKGKKLQLNEGDTVFIKVTDFEVILGHQVPNFEIIQMIRGNDIMEQKDVDVADENEKKIE